MGNEKAIQSALKALLEEHVDLCNSGDCGSWDCEKDEVVINARKALSGNRLPDGVYCVFITNKTATNIVGTLQAIIHELNQGEHVLKDGISKELAGIATDTREAFVSQFEGQGELVKVLRAVSGATPFIKVPEKPFTTLEYMVFAMKQGLYGMDVLEELVLSDEEFRQRAIEAGIIAGENDGTK